MPEDGLPNQAMPSKSTPDRGPAPTTQATGSQSGATAPAGQETANDPMRDPSAAGADLYNSGNKTGNPVKSGTPTVGDDADGVLKTEKKTLVSDKDDESH